MAPVTKRRKLNQIEEITFDPAARQEYLTGFHKRKQERIQHARDTAVKRAREDKIKERRELREQRKEDLDKHVAAINAELRKQNEDYDSTESTTEVDGGNEEWNGIADGAAEIGQEEEYVDEDKYTTVTVEAIDHFGGEESEDAGEDVHEIQTIEKRNTNGEVLQMNKKKKRIWSKEALTARAKEKSKTKKKKFRYESKAERQASRQKQKLKSHAAKARRMAN